MFVACSDDVKDSIDGSPEIAKNPTEVAQKDIPVLFDSYVNRATTRAGLTDDITDAAIKVAPGSATWGGFGVFAYYTDNKEYDQLATPNFFYNQLVKHNAGNYWEYEPVKYWPNEYGSSAESDDADKVSFFAYAPYVEVTPASGKLTANNNGDDAWGITGMTRNTASGDPIIKYIGSFLDTKSVDLCWGVSNTASWPRTVGTPDQTIETGKPWLNVERPAQAQQISATSTQNVKFQFLHALAKLQFTVNAFVDGTDATNLLNSKSRIWIRSIRFVGFAMKGALNLNNETPNEPYWLNYNGIGDLESDGEVIVYDGRKDGKEGVTGSEATNEKVLGLNKKFIETEASFKADATAWADDTGDYKDGVTKEKVPLFDGTGIFYAIPTGDDLEVEIVYDVETIDANLGSKLANNATAGSSIENRISKKITFGGVNSKLNAGKAYVINLHLGMNDVNFDAAVADWEAVAPVDVDLPANVQFFTAAIDGTGTATIPYNATSYQFGIKGLNGGEAITASLTSAGSYSNTATNVKTENTNLTGYSVVASTNANTSGYVVETLTTSANTLTTNRVQVANWTGGVSHNKVDMTFTQLAAPLALKAPGSLTPATGPTYEYQLQRTGAAYGFFCTSIDAAEFKAPLDTNGNPEEGKNGIKVWRNGTALTYNATAATAGEFKFDDKGKLTVIENFVAGDVIKVMLKTGDAPAETITWTVAAP